MSLLKSARKVKLGGQAHMPDAEGVWFELVKNVSGATPVALTVGLNSRIQVNWTCSNSTDQVRSIAKVTTAVAKGDLTQRMSRAKCRH